MYCIFINPYGLKTIPEIHGLLIFGSELFAFEAPLALMYLLDHPMVLVFVS